jgi:hypothetical protein
MMTIIIIIIAIAITDIIIAIEAKFNVTFNFLKLILKNLFAIGIIINIIIEERVSLISRGFKFISLNLLKIYLYYLIEII